MQFNVIAGGRTLKLETDGSRTLLEILQQNRLPVYAPCGGRGICGKCLVHVTGEGEKQACGWVPREGAEVVLPGKEEARILVTQTALLEDYPAGGAPDWFPGNASTGVAIDIGTTTLVLYFVDLVSGKIRRIASLLNPQRSFGADVIARIRYCQEHEEGTSRLRQILLEAINAELDRFAAAKETGGRAGRVAVTGNSTMLHLFWGISPVPLALAPFTLQFEGKRSLPGEASGLHVHPRARVETLPPLSAFVGADVMAGLAALKEPPARYLFLDIGTNGEIALSVDGKILSCATAAGPAFEGAGISCGMGAVTGAISRFDAPGDFQVIGHTPPAGFCGSGILDATAWLLSAGIVDETGYMKNPWSPAPDSGISVTPADIREIQLAKSAIYSGMAVLLKQTGLAFGDLDALFLAGGFGNYLRLESAIAIGLIPATLASRCFPVGNSALAGALQYVKSPSFEKKIDETLRQSAYLELSNRDDFALEFAMNMHFGQSGN